MRSFLLLVISSVFSWGCRHVVDDGPPFNALEPDMVAVQGGKFMMGSIVIKDEMPVHEVTISSFRMCTHEVTIAEFRQFIKNTGYITDAEKEGNSYVFDGKYHIKKGVTWECNPHGDKRTEQQQRYPVVHVSWNDAVAYCAWLTQQTGKPYRLPTEAEWEYAAKGGSEQKSYTYSGGEGLDSVGWFEDNSNWSDKAVVKKKPNSLGVYDMSGNVWEWCHDRYSETYYSESPRDNPKGPSEGVYRLLRGGSWNYGAIRSRVACRDGTGTSDCGYYNVGFRVVCSE